VAASRSRSTPARRQRGERRRREILEAALRVIGRDGVAGLTHRAVADEAGVSLAATTYYFASKADLLREASEL
jgi:DNA-binding transcriptional regulator YbjK